MGFFLSFRSDFNSRTVRHLGFTREYITITRFTVRGYICTVVVQHTQDAISNRVEFRQQQNVDNGGDLKFFWWTYKENFSANSDA